MATITASAPTNVTEARAAGLEILSGAETMVAAYFELPFGEVVVTRSGDVFLAAEYNAGLVG